MNTYFEQHLWTATYQYFMDIKLPENIPLLQTGEVYLIFRWTNVEPI